MFKNYSTRNLNLGLQGVRKFIYKKKISHLLSCSITTTKGFASSKICFILTIGNSASKGRYAIPAFNMAISTVGN